MNKLISLFETYEYNKKILKTKLQKDIITYLSFSTPLCAILWNKNNIPWFYEHFTSIYCIKQKNNYLWVDFLEDLYFPKDIAEYKFTNQSDANKIPYIIDYIKTMINNGYYIWIYIDEFFLPNKAKRPRIHKITAMFFYGYNDEKMTLYSIGFDQDKEFTFIEYSYDDIINGYTNGTKLYSKSDIWTIWYTITYLKIKNIDKQYQFNPKLFITNFKNYVFSIGDSSLLRPEIKYIFGDNAAYGIKVTDEIISSLYGLLDGNFTMDYRFIHLLSEHKTLLYKKLFYFIHNYCNNCYELIAKIEKYEELVHSMEMLRRRYLKQVLADNNFNSIYGQLKNKEFIEYAINSITFIRNSEFSILSDIYDKFDKEVTFK